MINGWPVGVPLTLRLTFEISQQHVVSHAPVKVPKGNVTPVALPDGKAKAEAGNVLLQASGGSLLLSSKAILAAQSPVFRAMLEAKDSLEAKDKLVTIREPFEVVTAFAGFLATNELKVEPSLVDPNLDVDEIVCRLLQLGDKYDVKYLVQEAENWLMSRLKTARVLRFATLAAKIGAKRLLDECVNYIVHNRGSPELNWEEVCSSEIAGKILKRWM